MSEEKSGRTATILSVLALVISLAALILQFKEREDRIADRAEVLDYEIGAERVDAKQYDDYIKIYNLSRGEVRLESVELRADMGDGVFKKAVLAEPQRPAVLEAGQFKEFRFRLNNSTPKDAIAQKSGDYESFTGLSTVQVVTTRGTRLTFESDYHPYLVDRIQKACQRSPCDATKIVNVQ
jgi:hypothetical protein